MKSIFIKTLALVLMIFLILNVCTYVTEKQDVITWVKDKFFTKQKNETKQPKDNSNQDIQNIDDYETELIQEFSEIYYVKNKTVKYKSIKEDGVYCPTADILKVKNINGKTIISILLKNYSTEPGIVHKVEVLNEDGKIISGKEKQDIIGGYLSDIYVDKLDINAKITINLFEYYSYLLEDDYNDNNLELLSKATIDIDFSKDLYVKEYKEVIKETKEWQSLEFKYDSEAEITEEAYGYVLDDSKSYYLGFEYSEEIEKDKITKFWIDISCAENELEITDLNELVKDLEIAQSLGGYPLKKNLVAYFEGESGEAEETQFTFDELIRIYNGEKIKKGEITYSIDSFSKNYTNYTNIEEAELDNGNIKAVTFVDSECRKYVFIIDKMFYQISIPLESEYANEIQEFMNDIKLIKN